MANTITWKVDGLQQLGERMRKLSTEVATKTAWAATGSAASVVKRLAKANIISSPSVRTGSLENAVIAKRIPKGQTKLTAEHIVTVRGRGKKRKTSTVAPHGHFVEFGTRKMPAEPFLRPALDHGKDEAVEAMAKKLRQRITKAGA